MSKRATATSPFAGLRLSDAGGLDQRLFQPATHRPRMTPAATESAVTSPVASTSDLSAPMTPEATSPGQSVHESVEQSTDPSGGPVAGGERLASSAGQSIVARPKAFYITQRLDARLESAVRYYQEQHGIPKVDRSTIINALLDRDELWSDDALDGFLDRVLGQLTSRLVGRARAPQRAEASGRYSYGPDTREQP